MSPFIDESLVATTVAVASKLSLDLEIGLEACTLFNIAGPSLFGSSKASLQPGVVSALSAETNEAALSRLVLSTQVVFSEGLEESGSVSGGTSLEMSSQESGTFVSGPLSWSDFPS